MRRSDVESKRQLPHFLQHNPTQPVSQPHPAAQAAVHDHVGVATKQPVKSLGQPSVSTRCGPTPVPLSCAQPLGPWADRLSSVHSGLEPFLPRTITTPTHTSQLRVPPQRTQSRMDSTHDPTLHTNPIWWSYEVIPATYGYRLSELNSQSVVESKVPYVYVWNMNLLLLASFSAQPAFSFVLVLFYHLPYCTSWTCTSLFVFVCLALSLLRVVALV